MSAPQVVMRKIKDCLRLKLDCGLSHEHVARALGLSKGVVSKYVAGAQALGLDWPALAALDETAIAARLYSPVWVLRGDRALIDLARVHRDLRRKGIAGHAKIPVACRARAIQPDRQAPSQVAALR